MGQSGMQSLLYFFNDVNWKSVVSIIFGAVISSVFSYIFTKWRENQRLRVELQVKTAEQILECAKIFNDASAKMSIPCISSFSGYNITLQSNKMLEIHINDPFNTDECINEIRRKQIEQAKNNIFKPMSTYEELWQNYGSAFVSIINILESKEVILNRFINFKDSLLNEFDKISKIHNNITHIYYFEISGNITSNNPIEEKYLNELNNYEDEFLKIRVNITAIIMDLKVGVQNEFLKKLFKHEVSYRKPLDEDFPVIKPMKYKKSQSKKNSSKNLL